jgi:hypothetical protein
MARYTTQNDVMLRTMVEFYSRDDYGNLRSVLPIINGEAPLSLRLIDWFVTNYAKCNYIRYQARHGRFVVHEEYRLRLNGYKKRRFDPFCRWDRVEIPFENDTYVQTTIGQLNFFKWALENGVLKYIEDHRAVIEEDMARRGSTARAKSTSSGDKRTRRRRRELSMSATRVVRKDAVEVSFGDPEVETSAAGTTSPDGIDAQPAIVLSTGTPSSPAVYASA